MGDAALFNQRFFPFFGEISNNYLIDVLDLYNKEEAYSIASNTIKSVSQINDNDIGEMLINWILPIMGHCLKNISNDDLKNQVLNNYIRFLRLFMISSFTMSSKNKNHAISAIIMHCSMATLTKVFHIMNNNQSIPCIIKETVFYNQDLGLYRIALHFFLGGAIENMENTRSSVFIDFSNCSIDALSKVLFASLDDFREYDSKMQTLMKLDVFSTLFMKEFAKHYFVSLNKNEKELFITYSFHCIDSMLTPKRQYDSFKLIVQQMQNEFPKGKQLCLTKWPIEKVKESFLKWIQKQSIIDDVDFGSHLFYLYCFGDKETTPEIRDICFSCTEHFLLQTPTQSLISSFLDILIGNVSFLNNMEISSRTAKFVINCFKSNLPDVSLSSIIPLVTLLLGMNCLPINDRFQIECTLPLFSGLQISDLLSLSFVHIFFVSLSQFWSTFHLAWDNYESKESLSLYASFIPILINSTTQSNLFSTNFWKKFTSNSDHRYLLAFLTLALGTDHFAKNTNDAVDIMMYLPTNDECIVFSKAIKNAILCGKYYQKRINNQNKQSESYISRSYVITINQENELIIRHGFGISAFKVENKSSLPHSTKDKPVIDTEQSIDKCKNDFITDSSIDSMESLLNDPEDFLPYNDNPESFVSNDSYSFLVDMGFFNYNNRSCFKKVPNGQHLDSILDKIDSHEPLRIFDIGVLQINDTGTQFVSKDTVALNQFLHDMTSSDSNLGEYNTPICKFALFSPCRSSNTAKDPSRRVREMGLVFCLNEHGFHFNHNIPTDKPFEMLIDISPMNDFYDIRLVQCLPKLILPFPTSNQRWVIPRSKAYVLLYMIAFIFFSSPSENPTRGPDCFLHMYKTRIDIINDLYNQTKVSDSLSIFSRAKL